MTRRALIVAAAGGSAALLAAAFAFQYLGGLAPCQLCLWQRWPHAAAVAVGGIGLMAPALPVVLLGAAAAMTAAALGVFHTGVERAWWDGPAACAGGGDLSGLTGAELLDPAGAAPLVMCDEVAWSLLGLSMASWNALSALALAGLWVAAARAG